MGSSLAFSSSRRFKSSRETKTKLNKNVFDRIVVLSEKPLYSIMRGVIQSIYSRSGAPSLAFYGNVAESIHLKWLLEALEKAVREGLVRGVSGNTIYLSRGFGKDSVAVENYGLFRGRIENGALYAPVYIVALTLEGMVAGKRAGAVLSRLVVYNDEQFAYVYLFKHGDRYYVYKELTYSGDEYDVLREYDSFEKALADYRTIDFGWEAKKLPVKPLREWRVDKDIRVYLWRTGKFNIENILKILENGLYRYKVDNLNVLEYVFDNIYYTTIGDTVLSFTGNEVITMRPLTEKQVEMIREIVNDFNSKFSKENEKIVYVEKTGDVYRVKYGDKKGMVVVGVDDGKCGGGCYVYGIIKPSKKKKGRYYMVAKFVSKHELDVQRQVAKTIAKPEDIRQKILSILYSTT